MMNRSYYYYYYYDYNRILLAICLIFGLFGFPTVLPQMRQCFSSLGERIHYDGERSSNDKLAYNITVKTPHKVNFTYNRDERYVLHHHRRYKITYVTATDILQSDGSVFIVEGGIGYHNVIVCLRSAPGGEMHYKVSVYAEPVTVENSGVRNSSVDKILGNNTIMSMLETRNISGDALSTNFTVP